MKAQRRMSEVICVSAIAISIVNAATINPRRDSTQRPMSISNSENSTSHRPLVIWHGLGDTALSEGVTDFINDIKSKYPGIFVHSVQIPQGGNLDAERKAGFFGKMEDQAMEGCEQIAGIPELSEGFDGMGFSQGGLYLRSYAQNCNNPPMRNLITFGTPHYGISSLLPCPTPPTLQCRLAARAAKSGIYTTWAQDHLVSAQYFRDPNRLGEYGEMNTFLTGLNNETISEKLLAEEMNIVKGNGTGRVDGLENFVAVMFDADLSPAESAHFGTYFADNRHFVIPLPLQPLYTEDWIGLRTLDERGKLHLEHCPGAHMDLDSGDCAKRVVEDWVGKRV